MSNITISQLPEDVIQHIEHLERVRRDFIANVSHELRTPLTVIRGYLESLIDQTDDTNPIWQNIFHQMLQHSLRMEHIIEDLLLLSRLENTEKEIIYHEQIPIAQLLEEVCEDAKHLSQGQHQITLEADPTVVLDGVDEELKSVFYNIIGNAIKYTPAGGLIHVTWQLQDKCSYFTVKDNGIGIEKKHIPRLTERFYRIDKARSRNSGGTGLGLAIAKHVLLRHHGELLIESQPGHGSTFTCRFPASLTHRLSTR